jgi:hypothetical protein
MAIHVRPVEYFYATIPEPPDEACRLLSTLAGLGINLLAFAAVPFGPSHTQLTIFPDNPGKLADEARRDGLVLDGPHPALLAQGDDELGALADVHATLYDAGVNVYASSGVADGHGSFGYVLYVRPEEFERAREALGL